MTISRMPGGAPFPPSANPRRVPAATLPGTISELRRARKFGDEAAVVRLCTELVRAEHARARAARANASSPEELAEFAARLRAQRGAGDVWLIVLMAIIYAVWFWLTN